MLLHNVSIVGDEDRELKEILVENSSIRTVLSSGSLADSSHESKILSFEKAIAFPGLINSHDHLDFNLFPSLRNRIYRNYREWGNDIHATRKQEINAVLAIPQHVRIQWGMYKNLLNGFTTVVNHGDRLAIDQPYIHVYQSCTSVHSVGFEKNWRWKLNKPRANKQPFVVHTGEGVDAVSHREINSFIRWNLFGKPVVGIHGVAMNKLQAANFKALVWCPDSNYFLLDTTARINELKEPTKILFGTDSTLTSSWDAWGQIRKARKTGMLTDKELYDSLTVNPAGIWGLKTQGSLLPGYDADIVIAKHKEGLNAMNAFYELNAGDILLILKSGAVQLFDEKLSGQLQAMGIDLNAFSRISSNGSVKYVIGNLPALIDDTQIYHKHLTLPVKVDG